MPRGKGLTWKAAKAQEHSVDLPSLVDHREHVEVSQTVEQVYDRFRHHAHEFAAVVDGETYVGLISRGHIGYLLGTRFGFTLHSRHLIQEHLLPESLVASPSMPLMDVLGMALTRTGEAFYHDVPLVEKGGRFIGIIPVPALVRAQSDVIAEQFKLAEFRRGELETMNKDLFRSLHQLRQSQGRYETLFQHSPLAVALVSPDGSIEAMNPKFQALLGPGSDATPRAPNLADLMSPRHREPFLKLLNLRNEGRSKDPGHADEFELHLPEAGARLFKFHTSLVQETGQICTILHDITEQRVIERKMAINDKAALFESLVGGIAHELNNKLVPVLGFSDLVVAQLEAQGGHDLLQSYCHSISRSAQESVRIIRQLLQLSRPATMELRRTDLVGVLDEATSIMRFRLRAAEAELKLTLPEHPVEILADAGQVKQVLINLMINAVDAMEHCLRKELNIRIEVQGNRAIVSIDDTGHGIPADKLNRIFDPFYTTKTAERGTGLGLSVCLGIIRQHHGEISVTSTPGNGTQFRVLLPLVPSDESGPSSHVEARRTGAGMAAGALPLQDSGLDVLVIDDEDYVTGFIQELLRSHLGWRVECVHDGRQAIQRLESRTFDLVITDLRMPGIDGFAILGWIRDFRPALLSKVLVITGDSGSRALDQELIDLGVPALRKPFTPEELVSQCRDLLVAT